MTVPAARMSLRVRAKISHASREIRKVAARSNPMFFNPGVLDWSTVSGRLKAPFHDDNECVTLDDTLLCTGF